MSIKLESTRKEFVVEDESGYKFRVVATKNEPTAENHPCGPYGWSVTISAAGGSGGFTEAAIMALRSPVGLLLEMLKAEANEPRERVEVDARVQRTDSCYSFTRRAADGKMISPLCATCGVHHKDHS